MAVSSQADFVLDIRGARRCRCRVGPSESSESGKHPELAGKPPSWGIRYLRHAVVSYAVVHAVASYAGVADSKALPITPPSAVHIHAHIHAALGIAHQLEMSMPPS